MRGQKGFTLVELVVVIAILGLLAAFAIPRYISLEASARAGLINGIAGAARSANALVYALSTANGTAGTATSSVDALGATVATAFGYPQSATGGINNAVQFDTADYTFTTGTSSSTFGIAGYSGSNCLMTYTQATSATVPSTIVVDTTGC